MSRRFVAWMAAGYAVALFALLFSPISWWLNRLTVHLYVWWRYTARLPGQPLPATFGFLLNVALFVPAGVFLVSLLRTRWWVATLLGVALSTCVELIQLIPVLHRESQLSDIVANGVGTLIGAAVASAVSARHRPGPGARPTAPQAVPPRR